MFPFRTVLEYEHFVRHFGPGMKAISSLPSKTPEQKLLRGERAFWFRQKVIRHVRRMSRR